jgi:RNA polymerase sigma factor for flagellar operon FliA
MPDLTDPSTLFEAHRQWIQKVAEITCRRNGVWGDDAEDFVAMAMMKVVDNDFAVLRQYERRAGLKTYLATVVTRRFYGWARERWGRWRHSARAEQLGQAAKDLEGLVYRDGYGVREAVQALQVRGCTLSERELLRLFDELPVRTPHHGKWAPEPVDGLEDGTPADARVIAFEDKQRCDAVMELLLGALSGLDPEDRVLVLGRFGEGRKVADIARALQREQMPLYRRSERLRNEIRVLLEASGVSRDDVRECLGLEEP